MRCIGNKWGSRLDLRKISTPVGLYSVLQHAELPVNGHDLEGVGCFLRKVDLKGSRLAVKTDHMPSK